MVSGNHHGASPKPGSKMPDMPDRHSQRQTIPNEAEDELPPAYEEGSRQHAGQPRPVARPSSSSTPSDRISTIGPDIPLVATGTSRRNDPEGYLVTDPMRWELKAQRGDWDKYDDQAGCLCSETGGILCSSRGGVMCSDREGYFCSDRNGRFFSDTGGLWCSDLGGTCCSSGGNQAEKRKKMQKQQSKASCDGP